jgi:hypothetical protein
MNTRNAPSPTIGASDARPRNTPPFSHRGGRHLPFPFLPIANLGSVAERDLRLSESPDARLKLTLTPCGGRRLSHTQLPVQTGPLATRRSKRGLSRSAALSPAPR